MERLTHFEVTVTIETTKDTHSRTFVLEDDEEVGEVLRSVEEWIGEKLP